MMPLRFALALIAGLALLAASPRAAVVTAPSFESLVASAGDIFLGQVTARASRLETRGGKRLVVTDVTFRTEDVLKGTAGALTTLTFVGGQVGDVRMEVPGMPTFMVGDRDVLFVQPGRPALMPIVAMFHGRFRVVTGPGGAGAFVANNSRQPLTGVGDYARPARVTSSVRPVELTTFLSAIRALVRR
jgi:hypothetical protein